jgi:predicted phosphate transport protein (TIGR00153 family)
MGFRGRQAQRHPARWSPNVVSLFPRQDDFFGLFRRQAGLVRQGCDQLHEMMTQFDRLEERAKELKQTEQAADLVTHEVFEKLNRTFITPLEREDIMALASRLDDVLDAAEAIASRIVLFRVPSNTDEATRMTAILARCGHQIEMAIDQLRDFKRLKAFTIEINRLENEADIISREVVANLFTPGKYDVLDILRWKELYGRMETAADLCEDVANVIESIVVKAR